MREQIDLLWSYVRGMWRFRWYALALAWVVALAGWGFSLKVPYQYQSSAQIHVDTQSMLAPLMRGLVVQSNVERRVELMTRTLLSRPNLEEIARQTDLDLQAGSPVEFDRIVDDLESRLRLSSSGRDNLYNISYRGEDPQLARDVVQAALNLLVEESMGRSREDTDSATRFLDRKIEEYKQRMEAAEQRRIEFQRQHATELAGTGGDYYNRLQQRKSELEAARFELELARTRQNELERQLVGETPVFGIMPDEQTLGGIKTPELDQKIARLEEELDQLLIKYTEQHPRVDTLRAQLDRIREQRDEERRRIAAARAEQPQQGAPSLDRNPVHQEIRASLAQARANVAAAQARVKRYEQQVAKLQELVDRAPEVDAQFAELQREYQSIKETHDQLVERRQTAEISSEVERSDDQVEFRVVEPPRVPNDPVAPNRPLLVTASLGAAAAGYGAIALMLTLVWPAFYNRAQLYHSLQMPVLGAIEHVRTKAARRRWWLEMTLYVMAVTGLLGAYGVVMALAIAYF